MASIPKFLLDVTAKSWLEDITEQYTKQGIMLYLQTKDTGANLLLKLILDDIPEPLIL